MNEVALEALARSVGDPIRHRSLRGMPGSWSRAEARDFDRFLDAHRKVDEELWK